MKNIGALNGNMLLVRIIENNKIDVYFRSGHIKKRLVLPRKVRKVRRIMSCRVRVPCRI